MVLNRFFLLVAKSKSQEAFLAVILLTVIALSSITEGLGLSDTLGAFLAGTLLSETKYTPQVPPALAARANLSRLSRGVRAASLDLKSDGVPCHV